MCPFQMLRPGVIILAVGVAKRQPAADKLRIRLLLWATTVMRFGYPECSFYFRL
jgi:hypothetical protein